MPSNMSIGSFIERNPITIQQGDPIPKALEKMETLGIRHLPVMDQHKLVGILSDRDIAQAASQSEVVTLRAEDVMTRDPYHVSEEAALSEVLEVMVGNRMGCVIVLGSGGRLVGIFTAIDAMRHFSRFLKGE